MRVAEESDGSERRSMLQENSVISSARKRRK
jgi:hypothetical protein